jgi:hypothetical protein
MVKVERSTWKADKLTELQVWELTKYVPGKAP